MADLNASDKNGKNTVMSGTECESNVDKRDNSVNRSSDSEHEKSNSGSSSSNESCSCGESDNSSDNETDIKDKEKNNVHKTDGCKNKTEENSARKKRKRFRKSRQKSLIVYSTDVEEGVSTSCKAPSKENCEKQSNVTQSNTNNANATVPNQNSSESSDFSVGCVKRLESVCVTSPYDDDGDRVIGPDGAVFHGRKHDKVDHTEPGTSDDTADTDSTCTSDEDCQLVESEKALIEICGDSDFFRIDSRTGRYKDKTFIRHYVVKIERTDIEGDTGLRPQDELLKVNGKSLKNKKQKRVKKIFRKIKLDHKTNQVKIQLRVRRWFPDPQRGPLREKKWLEVKEYVLNLVLVPTDDDEHEVRCDEIRKQKARRPRTIARRQSFKVDKLNKVVKKDEKLSDGYIEILGLKKSQWCRFRSEVHGHYISDQVQESGRVGLSVITDNDTCQFRAEHFYGIDKAPKSAFSNKYIFCVRLCIDETSGPIFVASDIAHGGEHLMFVKEHKDDIDDLKEDHIIDERCFITRAIGDIIIFQSLIFRDRFISVSTDGTDSGQLYLVQISKAEQNAFVAGEEDSKARNEAYYNAARKFEPCKFEKFVVKHGFRHRMYKAVDGLIRGYLCGLGRTGARGRVSLD